MSETTLLSHSAEIFRKSQHYMPGGVNSPVRAFKAVGGQPLVFKCGVGPYLIDVDDRRYIDYVGSWGPLILGHAYPSVIDAVQKTAAQGLSFGAPCELELKLAQKICELMPNIEKLRFVSSGTEATMTAIRLTRGITGRDKIIKFEGCYHGHSDSLLVKAGSGALTLGIPSSPGVPAAVSNLTLVAEFNNLNSVTQLFEQHKNEIAGIIVEPIAGNMNLIPARKDFLLGLRQLCDQHGALLIFDEVMTGFRVALGGAQSLYEIKPDITTLGKVIGGGMPVGAIAGSAAVMDTLAPIGAIYQAGTLSGNPVTMAAGLATLTEICKPDFFADLSALTQSLAVGLATVATQQGVELHTRSIGSMFGIFFSKDEHIDSFKKVTHCDVKAFNRFFHAMLKNGIYLAPSAFEAGFVSSAHQAEHIEKTLHAARKAFS